MGINGPPSYTYCANGEHNMLWIWPRILPLIIKGKGKGKGKHALKIYLIA